MHRLITAGSNELRAQQRGRVLQQMGMCTEMLSGGVLDDTLPLYSAHHQLLRPLGEDTPSKCSTELSGECRTRTSNMSDQVHVFTHSSVRKCYFMYNGLTRPEICMYMGCKG